MWEAIDNISAVFLAVSPRSSAEHCCERKGKPRKALAQISPIHKCDQGALHVGYKVARILVCVNKRKRFEQTFARSTKDLVTKKPDLDGNLVEETVEG